MKKPTPIDTNLIIRFLANDTPIQAQSVELLLKKSPKNSLLLTDVMVAEIVWVLSSFYKLEKSQLTEKLEALIGVESLKTNQALIEKSLSLFRELNISYNDAYHCAYAIRHNNGVLYSFDQGIDQVSEVTRIEP